MRFIPTRFHAPLDYIVGVALIAAPWIFRFSEDTAATVVPIVLGIGLIAYSLFTNYELGVWKVVRMAVHNLFDVGAGAFSPSRRGSSASPTRARTSGCRMWSSVSPRSSSAWPRSNPPATGTAAWRPGPPASPVGDEAPADAARRSFAPSAGLDHEA